MSKQKKSGRPQRSEGGSTVRVPFLLSEAEVAAFDEARTKAFPGASKGYVLRHLLAEFCAKNKIQWPEEQR